MTKAKKSSNQAVQAERRRLLIDATITAISEHGLNNLTLAKIASIAGLSAGSVNFHFDSKETLLLETLTFLAREFEDNLERTLASAGPAPADKLLALFDASLDPDITEPRKTAVWFAFNAEAHGRKDYKRICGAQDQQIFAINLRLCDEIIHAGGKDGKMNARAMANSVQGLIDEIWQEILYAGDSFDRDDARNMYLSYLASVFPWAYSSVHVHQGASKKLSTQDKSLRIRKAEKSDIRTVSALFDCYRQFYEEPADLKLATQFIGHNIRKQRSTIYLAQDKEDTPLGFVQLYPGWCSVAAAPLWTLYDLYVNEKARGLGVGRALMLQAEKLARKTRACRIDLETAIENYNAQALYEDLGYEKDRAFYKYSLELDLD